jgi:hypothetical protein
MNLEGVAQPDPWKQVDEVVEKINKKKFINLDEAQTICESIAKTNDVDQKILEAWENAFRKMSQNIDPNAHHLPLDFVSCSGIHHAVSDATCRALQKQGFNIATANNEEKRNAIVQKVLDDLQANKDNRIAIYDQSEHSFYVYKFAENKVQGKKITKSEAMTLPQAEGKHYIGAPNPEKA